MTHTFPDELPQLSDEERQRVNQKLLDNLGLLLSWSRRVMA